MAKLNVDEIEANGTNSNVKVTTKGTDGSCEIKAATNDATLQLNCSVQTHGVKLKAPANSDGQNYTMILPDNQIAANKLLKVKSVTNNVGQLEYADGPSSDISSTSLNADNITSGSLPAARFPTFLGSTGAALELVSEQTVGSTNDSEIIITGFEDDTVYKLVVPQLKSTGSSGVHYINWLDSSNNVINSLRQEYFYHLSNSYPDKGISSSSYQIMTDNSLGVGYVADISNKAGNMWMIINGFASSQTYYGQIENYVTSTSNTDRIYGLKFHTNSSSRYYMEGSKVLLYKYKES